MNTTAYFQAWEKALTEGLHTLTRDAYGKEESAYARTIGNVIINSGRLRFNPLLNSREALLLKKTEKVVSIIQWTAKVESNAKKYFNELLFDCNDSLGKFDDGLVFLGDRRLSELAREVVLSRDAISLLTAWHAKSDRNYPGTNETDRYPFDKRIRDLLPNMDLYLGGWRNEFSSFENATWVWKERLGCLSSVALVQIQEGAYQDLKSARKHLAICDQCRATYESIDIPRLDESIVKKKKETPALLNLHVMYKKIWEKVRDILSAPAPSPELQAASRAGSALKTSGALWRDQLLHAYLWKDPESMVWVKPKPGGLEIRVTMAKKAPIYFMVTDGSGNRVTWDKTNKGKSGDETIFSIDIRRNPLPLKLSLRSGAYRKSIHLDK